MQEAAYTTPAHRQRSALVITGATNSSSPQAGLIADRLSREGVRTSLRGRGATAAARFFDVVVKGALDVRHHDALLITVFGQRAFAYEAAAIAYGKLFRRRTVIVLRGGEMPAFVTRWSRIVPRILNLADVVVVPHDYLHQKLRPLGVRVDEIVPNVIELERYPFKQRSKVGARFLYLRGLHPHYNPHMAIRAFALIQERRPDASLTMAGAEDIDAASTRALAAELKVRNVSFVGMVSKQRVIELAGEHDIHIVTNRFDNFPVSLVEMWACGLPVVATAVQGIPYLVRDGHDALLVPSDDHQAMARECLRLLDSPEVVERLSRNGRARAEALGWDVVGARWQELLFKTEA
jgi:glycosyltransferase involved in cell wall biosynthesis